MNLQIVALLGQDGITNGAIYALLALCILLVFTVTRVLYIPQGEFVAFGALTLAALQAGQASPVVWFLAVLCWLGAAMDVTAWLREQRRPSRAQLAWLVGQCAYPLVLAAVMRALPLAGVGMAVQIALTLALLVPMGPLFYRIVFQPIAEKPSLVLLVAAIAVHVAMVGVGLLVFGPDGARTEPFSDAIVEFGVVRVKSQALWVLAVSAALLVALALLAGRTLYGKALRAAAMNRIGAQLMGISPTFAGRITFTLATAIGVMSGVLISPITTLYYDSGFLISLKGFVGSIIGGLLSYPVAAAGAVLVGLLEAFSAFWASTYKEVIVFTLIIPVLLWRSLTTRHVEEQE